jgi:hypothetical protein
MQTINIIAHTNDVSQLETIKAFFKALKIKFEINNEAVHKKMKRNVMFKALSIDTKGYKFNRDEANER